MKIDCKPFEEKMKKTISVYQSQLDTIRAGRANPAVLNGIMVEYYGTSDIGITPMSDGKVIRLTFPQPTEERRRELTKQTAKMGEDTKVGVRNIRRDAVDAAKAMKKNGEMTEDELKSSEKLIQDLTDKYIKEIDAVTAKKNAEIMEV